MAQYFGENSLFSLLAIIATAIIAIGFAYRYVQLRREEVEDIPETTEQMLARFERSFFAGEIDAAELERIKASLRGEKPAGRETPELADLASPPATLGAPEAGGSESEAP